MEYNHLTGVEKVKVLDAMKWIGFDDDRLEDIDICESGQVYIGLIEILPRGSIDYQDY